MRKLLLVGFQGHAKTSLVECLPENLRTHQGSLPMSAFSGMPNYELAATRQFVQALWRFTLAKLKQRDLAVLKVCRGILGPQGTAGGMQLIFCARGSEIRVYVLPLYRSPKAAMFVLPFLGTPKIASCNRDYCPARRGGHFCRV